MKLKGILKRSLPITDSQADLPRKKTNFASDKSKNSAFSEIPAHTLVDILKKVEFPDFVNFKKCSKETLELTKNFRQMLPLKVSEIDFREDTILIDSKDEFKGFPEEKFFFETEILDVFNWHSNGISLEEFCINSHIKAEQLHICLRPEDIDPQIFNNVLKLLKVKRLEILAFYPPAELFEQPEFQKLEHIDFYIRELKSFDFLSLQSPRISVYPQQFSLDTINKFFKQWLHGQRTIERLQMDAIPMCHSAMFKGMKYNVLYKEGMPKLTDTIDSEKLRKVYSLKRNDQKLLYICIVNLGCILDGRIRMVACESSNVDLKTWLSSVEI